MHHATIYISLSKITSKASTIYPSVFYPIFNTWEFLLEAKVKLRNRLPLHRCTLNPQLPLRLRDPLRTPALNRKRRIRNVFPRISSLIAAFAPVAAATRVHVVWAANARCILIFLPAAPMQPASSAVYTKKTSPRGPRGNRHDRSGMDS